MARSKKVTQKQIAQRANVSMSTVSRILNRQDELVSDTKRLAVQRAIHELHYVHPEPRQKKSPQGKRRVGVLIGNLQSESMAHYLSGILDVSQPRAVDIVLYDYRRDAEKEEQFERDLVDNGIDGLIVYPAGETPNPTLEELIRRKFPLVLLTKSQDSLARDDVFVVTRNAVQAVYSGVKYLLDLGHRDILFLDIPSSHAQFTSQLSGCRQAFEAINAELNEDLIVECADRFEDAYGVVSRLLGTRPFTAICGGTDTIAIGAWRAITDRGGRIPEDCSILGYGNLNSAAYYSLTTLNEPMREMGRSAIYMLLDILLGYQDKPHSVVLQDSLIIRDSCRQIR